jgi:hypothetical protein
VPRSEQSAIKVDAPAVAAEGDQQRAEDTQSPAHPVGFGRLLTVEKAAEYLALSEWSIRQYVQSGDIPVVEMPRPATASAIRTGKRAPVGNTLRKVLLDKNDLDEFVSQRCRKVRR